MPVMAALTFDTLRYANRLKEAGVPPAQAEAEAVALSEVLDVNLKELATKEDLKTMELRLTVKLGAFLSVAVGVLIAVLKLPH